ncbi:cell division ATP-binding protein FtsE [Brachybacterium muris]|uniref:cell division ATP-binding protein FtsE n=1 Tax=Brachybacterium muris TaxID=219301 RepID=UPI00223C06ED|nr:cell division ATP-binding protein FtsE [Brachybacterium muris]
MIRFDDVTKTYIRGQNPAVENLDIEFARGEFVFLVGASGSGKSTLMRMVLKETAPTSGTVHVAGKDLSRIPSWRVPALRRDIGMVFQDFRLLPSKTAYQNIEFALAVIGTPRKVVRRLVPEMLEMVGLEDKGRRLPHELSGGEQQRVAIARAYVNRPSILLADEPTGNLDPSTAEGILDLLAEINDRGTTVVMATHDRTAVDRMRRRVVEMVGGRVVRDDPEGTYESVAPVSVISGNLPDGSEDLEDREDQDRPTTDEAATDEDTTDVGATDERRPLIEPDADDLLDERDAHLREEDEAFAEVLDDPEATR